MIHTAVFTGLRISELVGLKWEDVHDDAITVDERYCRGDWAITKTAGSAATIGVGAAVIARIRRLQDVQGQMRHSRISTTMDIYAQHLPESQRRPSPR